MPIGLNLNTVVNINTTVVRGSSPERGFGTQLFIGDSSVINGAELLRRYTDLEGVAADFGLNAPEYDSARYHFSQSPTPSILLIGRWLRTATPAILKGGLLSTAEKQMSNWTSITTGSFTMSVNGTPQTVTGLDFSAQTNLNGVASIIDAALSGATVAWDGSRFIVTGTVTGAAATIGYATPAGSGADISTLLKLTSATALLPIGGFDAETAPECVAKFVDFSGEWYGFTFAASVQPSDNDIVEIGEYVEGLSTRRLFVVDELDSRAYDPLWTTNIGARLKEKSLQHTFSNFSWPGESLSASVLGRAATVNLDNPNSALTFKFKDMPGITPLILTATQAQTLKDKRINAFVSFNNGSNIYQEGVMASELFIDDRINIDYLENALQIAVWNELYTSTTKVPQTDDGSARLLAAVNAVLQRAVVSGILARGLPWRGDDIGSLKKNDILVDGYYTYCQTFASQNQADRELRKGMPIFIAAKFAGAIHSSDLLFNINR